MGALVAEYPTRATEAAYEVIHHHQSLFIHKIVSFYMVFLGIVFKTRLKYSKELFDYNVKIQKLTLLIIRVTMSHGVLK